MDIAVSSIEEYDALPEKDQARVDLLKSASSVRKIVRERFLSEMEIKNKEWFEKKVRRHELIQQGEAKLRVYFLMRKMFLDKAVSLKFPDLKAPELQRLMDMNPDSTKVLDQVPPEESVRLWKKYKSTLEDLVGKFSLDSADLKAISDMEAAFAPLLLEIEEVRAVQTKKTID